VLGHRQVCQFNHNEKTSKQMLMSARKRYMGNTWNLHQLAITGNYICKTDMSNYSASQPPPSRSFLTFFPNG